MVTGPDHHGGGPVCQRADYSVAPLEGPAGKPRAAGAQVAGYFKTRLAQPASQIPPGLQTPGGAGLSRMS